MRQLFHKSGNKIKIIQMTFHMKCHIRNHIIQYVLISGHCHPENYILQQLFYNIIQHYNKALDRSIYQVNSFWSKM